MRLLTLVVVVLVFAACADQGPLRTDFEGLTVEFPFDATPKSTGFDVCVADGPVGLASVMPGHVEGDIEYLGAAIVTDADTPIGTAADFPPSGYDAVAIEGATVTAVCDDESGGGSVQIVVGTDWRSDGGGAIEGFRVEYVYRGERGVLEIPGLRVVMCGAEGEYCEE